ncbi:MAG TPA: hypothetical protein VI819_03525 [Patescibacteria group bacterium]|nr:hypothetical protein [Patescibacteria group bacterium]
MPESNSSQSKDKSPRSGSVNDGRIEPEKDLYSWNAASRPYKKRDRDFWITTVLITGISGMILLFVEGFMPVILIISIIFLYYILNSVEPEMIQFKITNRGVKMADKLNAYDELGRYWFSKRYNNEIIVFEAYTIGGRLEMVINPTDKEKIKKALSKYLTFEEVPASKLDQATEWFSKKLPGNS